MSIIRLLPEVTINRIAAGEVIERPASAVKELVENSIDAGSGHIEITMHNGGRNLIRVSDDGKGMQGTDLELCVERHATSKLPGDDLFNIANLGFRGEALPSIGSVSRLEIVTKASGETSANAIKVEGGQKSAIYPSAFAGISGTKIEVKDLFFATPARLKFLKSERSELSSTKDLIERLSMAYPKIGFVLKNEQRQLLNFPPASNLKQRLGDVMGQEFIDNSLEISFSSSDASNLKISGFVSLATFNKATAASQYLFVNNRPIKDKLLIGALRAAYQDFLSPDRHPVVAIFIEISRDLVDVNAHPSKTEVRFRDSEAVRKAISAAIRNALSSARHRASNTLSDQAIVAFKSENISNLRSFSRPNFTEIKRNFASQLPVIEKEEPGSSQAILPFASVTTSIKQEEIAPERQLVKLKEAENSDYPLGLAKCQLHETYIIAQKQDSVIIVDQHAAHERIVYEKMKLTLVNNSISRQQLLVPIVVELRQDELDLLINKIDELAELGLIIEKFGAKAILVREVPEVLHKLNIKELVEELANDLIKFEEIVSLNEKILEVFATKACHGSIRAGRKMTIEEMNALLRQMENTKHSGQCNHGRPTYVELKLNDIEKLFGRK